MSRNVVVRYTRDVAAGDGRMAQFKGAEYVVSEADAERFHPGATVVGYEGANGQIEPIEKTPAKGKDKDAD